MNLYELINEQLLNTMIAEGYVRVRPHPDVQGYRIFNYTEKAQYERMWNEVTLNCRGLIVNGDNEIIARPWQKFFNYGEYAQGKVVNDRKYPESWPASLDLQAPVEVTDKLDGSLGILYQLPDGTHAVATRGSFTSDQALHATKVWRENYAGFNPLPGWTYLFEIIFPKNRIVLDYGSQDDLVFLGMRKHSKGTTPHDIGTVLGPYDKDWFGPRTKEFGYRTLAEALAAPPRKNAEGLVIRYYGSGLMLKLKQDDYVKLHRIVTGLSAKTVWESLMNGTFTELLLSVPDEFHEWVQRVASDLLSQYRTIENDVLLSLESIVKSIPPLDPDYRNAYRKQFAEKANSPVYRDLRPFLFLKLDGKKVWTAIWKTLKPRGDTYMMNYSEDVA